MKIHGKVLDEPNEEVIVIPRPTGDIVFKARAVLSYEAFEKIYPTPEPPTVRRPGNQTSVNIDDPKFKKKLEDYANKRTAWLIIKSLEATEGLEWETVDIENPESWENYLQELRDSKLNEAEITRIIQGVMVANALDDAKIVEARERFLAGQREEQEKSSSQEGEVNSTQSGEAANGSE